MKIKALLLSVILSIFYLNSHAQKKEFKFGKVDLEEFQTKPSGQDSAASAIKLFDIGNCYFEISQVTGGFLYVYEKHVRYKIINKNSYDLADYSVGLRKGNSTASEEIHNFEAATYNMVEGKIVTSKPNKDAKFSEEFNKNYTYKKIALPNVKEGSIIEFKFTIKSGFFFNLRGWNFQSDIPTLYSEFNVKIPQYLSYKTNISGYLPVTRTKSESINAYYINGLTSSANYNQYVLENVPALKDEAFITTLDDYKPIIDFELRSTHFPGELVRDYNSTWPKIIADLAKDENFGLFTTKNSYAKTILPNIIKVEKDTLEITRLILNHVKKNIKWNKDSHFYTNETNPKAVFEKKSGNSADINLILINLLREAKINASPVLLSTRSNGAHPGYPTLSKFDNVIAHVIIGNKSILIDATDEDLPLGMISYQNLNHYGFLINLKTLTGTWISTEPTIESEKTFILNLVLDNDHKLKGSYLQFAKGYLALAKRNTYRSTNNETEYLKNFKKDKAGLEISSYELSNLNNLNDVLSETMQVVIEDNVEEAGNLVYFSPLLFERTKENLLKQENRVFPVDFAIPMKETYRIKIDFPENYEIDKLPKNAAYKIPGDIGTFSISFLSQEKSLLVKSSINLIKSVYTPGEYFDLKELFKAIVEKQAEQIVFKKKS
ncbi:MAG: DUF3858 domain-containing protein [Bacteroidota bacterium]